MAYPKEDEHIDYLKYVERISLGDEPGPQMTKEEWRKQRQAQEAVKEQKKQDRTPRLGPSINSREW